MPYLCISWERKLTLCLTIIFLVQIGIRSQHFHEQKGKKFGFVYLKKHMLSFMDLMITLLRVFALKDLKP